MKTVKIILKSLFALIERVVIFILPERGANLFQTGALSWNTYFLKAEASIQSEWERFIWPNIKNFDFHDTLELSPGAGRNTERLCPLASNLYAVDYSSNAIKKCQQRLGNSFQGCQIFYYVNNGVDIRMIGNNNISTVYCWDSAVHFNKIVIESYIKEFARVLKHGGRGFVHHSNLGDSASRNIKKNPGWRSNVSKEFFSNTCVKYGLTVESQIEIPWENFIDCITIFSKLK